MKKILITAYNLDIGGIETSLINLLKNLDYDKFDVTLVLENKIGVFVDKVPNKVKLIDYNLSHSKNVLYRKIKNRLKLVLWKIKHKNKYDFSICYATHSFVGSKIALNASKKNVIWIHGNYCKYFEYNQNKINSFFKKINLNKFKNYVFVSNENKEEINKYYKLDGNQFVINNIIDGDQIIKNSKEKIEIKKSSIPTFLNVGRHDEAQKKLSRIITASKKLKEDGYKFKILIVGDGPDTNYYKNLVKNNNLEDIFQFLGKKSNPFPYFRVSEAVLLSSLYEGYPVVFNEARVLNIPIITTKVSDYKEIDNKYGIVVNQDNIYNGMKQFLDNGFNIKNKFDYNKYNKEIIKKIYKIID